MAEYDTLSQQYAAKDETYYSNPRPELDPYIPANIKKALDVGCGRGAFGAHLKSKGVAEVWGVEPDHESVTAASQVLDKAIEGVFQPGISELQGQKFDLISFNDVLEHLVDPGAALRACHDLLTENGQVLSSIPNILYWPVMYHDILRLQDWQYVPAGTLDATHLRFFTRKSIIRMHEENGFKVELIEGINPRVSRKYALVNALFGGKFHDFRYLQYATLASRK